MYRKNTATQFVCFQGVDATTGGIKSGVTWTIRRYIDGTAAAGGGTVTEDGTTGWYKYAMSQADTNGNNIGFNFTGTGAIPQTVNIVTTACDPTTATNFGITALPAVASGSAGAVLIDGTGTAAISNSSGKVLLQATQSGVTIPTVTTVTNQLTAAQVATGIWQDATAGDFTTASSIGKSLYTGNNIPGAAGGLFIAGTNAATTVTTSFTTTFTGNLTGSVASVTGAVGSVTARVTANADQWAGGTIPAVNVTGVPLVDLKYTLGTISPATPGSVRTDLVANSVSNSGTAQAGTVNTITLANAASSTNGIYDPSIVRITGGTGVGQARVILDYVGATRVCTVDRDWRTTPDATSTYDVLPATNLLSTNEGLAQAGAATTITLNSSASAVNSTYNGQIIVIRGGTGQDQNRIVTGYVGATKVATVDSAWATNPDSTSVYMMLQASRMDATISSRAIAGDAMALTAAYDFAKGTTAMAESYAADGATMTPAQALYQINQHLGESSIVSTTKTVKKRDGATTAKTFTLDSATAPTSITETT